MTDQQRAWTAGSLTLMREQVRGERPEVVNVAGRDDLRYPIIGDELRAQLDDALAAFQRALAREQAVREWVANRQRAEDEPENNGYQSAQLDVLAMLDAAEPAPATKGDTK